MLKSLLSLTIAPTLIVYLVIFSRIRWSLSVALICLSVMAEDAELYSYTYRPFLFVLLRRFYSFQLASLKWIFILGVLIRSSLKILDISLMSKEDKRQDIFSHSVGFLFSPSVVSLTMQKFLILYNATC